MIPGIPTMYDGVQYRSRLEARWARMFDLMGWKHQYEPFDLNGWIPDFLLLAEGGRKDVLVEVKPITKFDPSVAEKCDAAMRGTEYAKSEILLLGCNISGADWGTADTVRLGWLGERFEDGLGWADAVLCARGGFFHSIGMYDTRLGDGYWKTDDMSLDVALPLWKRAGNDVQWKSPRK